MIYAAYVFEAEVGEPKPWVGMGLKKVDEGILEKVYGVPKGSNYGEDLFSIAKYLFDYAETETITVCNVLGVYTNEERRKNFPKIKEDLEARTGLPLVILH